MKFDKNTALEIIKHIFYFETSCNKEGDEDTTNLLFTSIIEVINDGVYNNFNEKLEDFKNLIYLLDQIYLIRCDVCKYDVMECERDEYAWYLGCQVYDWARPNYLNDSTKY